ncbi:hypothetical protein [Klebsiella quasipneumoniae]|nr:hypothetical protein [Klebsiella pneumoniae]
MNDIFRNEDSVERIARFQSLQSGEFWKSKQNIDEEAIRAGDVLLLMSIRWVENYPHTVILRSHPRHYGEYVNIEYIDQNGKKQRTHKKMEEHRFLVNDFLDRFEFEPDHQQIREREVAAVHAEVAQIQQEMNDGMTNPALMRSIVEEQLKLDEERERKNSGSEAPEALPPALYDETVPMVTGTVQNALAKGMTPQTVNAMKLAAKREHRIAEIQSKWLESKRNQIGSTLKKLMPYFNEMPAAALAKTEDVREYVDKLQSGIQSIFLYTGEGVEIVPVKKGESAARDIPLTFVQRKLIVEEELAVWADLDEWFDFRSTELFFKALNEHPELVDQIFPSQRCVLVMAMTNHDLNYADPWANEHMNRQNRKVFLMVRDGENIYQVFSSVESHLGSARLFPSQDETESHFRGLDGSQIKFDDIAYTDRLKGFDLRALHYKRFLLLICGLDHREKLFGDFYDEPASMNFVSMQFQEDYCRFLHDEDGSGLLAANDERPSLSQYIREANAYMRSGSRMLCNWYSLMTPLTAPGACKEEYQRSYRSFYYTARPAEDISLSIAYRKAQSICVDVPVKREYSDSWFNCKVDLTASRGSYDDSDKQLPYLCLDAIEPDDLEWYVFNRKYRGDHLFYIRFFKMAIKFIRAEREEEQEVRERMADALDKGNIGMPDERPSLVKQAVIAWRAAQRGAPLRDALLNKKSWQSLLNQMYMLAGNADNEIDDVAKFVTDLGYKPLRIVVNASGKLAVYAESLEHERDMRVEKHVWVHRINLVRGKRKVRETSRTWAILPESLAAETTIHQWDEAQAWTGKKSVFSSFNAKQRIFERIEKCSDILKMFSGTMSREVFAPIFREWCDAYDALTMKSSTVVTPHLLIPFGYRVRDDEQDFLCVCVTNPEQLLYKLAPDEQSREAVRKAYIRWYSESYKEDYSRKLVDGATKPTTFSLYVAGDANISNGRLFNVAGYPHRVLGSDASPDRFADAMTFYKSELGQNSSQNGKKVSLYVSPQLVNEAGEVCIDELLNNPMPETYRPVDLVKVYLNDYRSYRSISDEKQLECHYAQTGDKVKFHEWYDICERDVTTDMLLAGVVSGDILVKRLPFNNRAAAQAYIKRNHFHDTYKPIDELEDVPEAAMPPAGVVRLVRA